MGLSPGTQLGTFKITGFIGEGGMGEVYRAKDLKLGREVAIKLLPAAFAQDRERLMRFKREAKILASLDHSNIGALYDFCEENGTYFLVLQLIEGDTLAERIERGPIPVKEALPLFVQIAEALEAAHEQGIIHRDLKPANIKVTRENKVKVLDFGMAKSHRPPKSISPKDPTRASNSAPSKVTTDGAILGTPSYMSPEQARGHDVDKRSDIWAFGCCLYEALTGMVPFKGETVVDTMNAILHYDPDWSALPKDAGPAVVKLVKRCLKKDVRSRLRDIGEARIEIREILTGPSFATPTAAGRSRRHAMRKRLEIPVAIFVLVSLALGLYLAGYFPSESDRPSGEQTTVLPVDVGGIEESVAPEQSAVPVAAPTDDGVTAEHVEEARAAALQMRQTASEAGADEHIPEILAEGRELLEEGERYQALNEIGRAVDKFDEATLSFARAAGDSRQISRELEDLEVARAGMAQAKSKADNAEASRLATGLYQKAEAAALEADNLNHRPSASNKLMLAKALYEEAESEAVTAMRLLLDERQTQPVASDDLETEAETPASVDKGTTLAARPGTNEEGNESQAGPLVVTPPTNDESRPERAVQARGPVAPPPIGTGTLTLEVKRARKALSVARGSHLKVFIDEEEIDVGKSITTSKILTSGPHQFEWSAYDGRGSKEAITIKPGGTVLIEIKERNFVIGGKGRVLIDGKEIRRYDW